MLHAIRQTIQLFSLGFVFLILASNTSKAWTYSEGEEDWGPTCFVKQQHPTGATTDKILLLVICTLNNSR